MIDDPRFAAAVAHFNAADFDEAADGFEELFFEAVREEVDVARALLQVSTGFFHAQCGQRRPAVERLEEGLLAIERVPWLLPLGAEVRALLPRIARGEKVTWPRVLL